MRMDRAAMIAELQQNGVTAEPSPLAPAGLIVRSGGNMAHTPWFTQGDFSVQDESSMLVAELVDPDPGMLVLDCCAAPGGKSTHMGEKMRNQGKIWAADLHDHKKKLIDQQAKRLQLDCIETMVEDARQLERHFALASFDRILLDAPCSGLGVIRRKPDIKWAKAAADIGEITALQQQILNTAAKLLRPGGILVYSTCTVESAENQGVISSFLQEHQDFALAAFPAHLAHLPTAAGMLQILPHEYHSDGFFMARLQKNAASLSN
jgi:16S rRNA (cytosine967-C5)-methyltransferase